MAVRRARLRDVTIAMIVGLCVALIGGAWLVALGVLRVEKDAIVDQYQIGRMHARLDALLAQDTRTIRTAHMALEVSRIPVPDEFALMPGGGITSFRDDTLLLTGSGSVLRFDADAGALEPTGLELPDNGVYDLDALAKADDLYIKVSWLRYNDILYREWQGRRMLLISYQHFDRKRRCFTSRVDRLDLAQRDMASERPGPGTLSAQAGDWVNIFTSEPCFWLKPEGHRYGGHQAGGRMALRADGMVMLTVGDYEFDGRPAETVYSQDLDVSYGKLLTLDAETGETSVFTLGHRNNQGITISKTGQIWTTEHGPQGGDELNRIVAGRNYGWPYATYGTLSGTFIWPLNEAQGRHDGFERPMYSWVPSIGVSNLTIADGFSPLWDGDLLVASLKKTTIYRMRVRDGRVVFVEPVPVGRRVRYIHQHSDGRLYVWTDARELLVIRAMEPPPPPVVAAAESMLDAKIDLEFARCVDCHGLGIGADQGAPSLSNVIGRPVGRERFGRYSHAMLRAGGVWTEARLAAFLADPQAVVPGTIMPSPDIRNDAVIRGIIRRLKGL